MLSPMLREFRRTWPNVLATLVSNATTVRGANHNFQTKAEIAK